MIKLDGKATAQAVQDKLKLKVDLRRDKGQKIPHLAAILVGNDGGSVTYVNAKVKACERIGYDSTLIKMPSDATEDELLAKVTELNENPEIDGFIVQLPLPDHIDEAKITLQIAPEKDVDGFHPTNLGNMLLGIDSFLPATPYGITKLLSQYEIATEGKHCVVIGRSNIVGSPMSVLMARNMNPGNCTVTLTHSRTKNIEKITKLADIIIVALGKPHFLKANMVKEGAIVVDVGTTRIEDSSRKSGFRLLGDVDFDEVAPKCSYISPVPGGVGPMTITGLLANTLKAAEMKD